MSTIRLPVIVFPNHSRNSFSLSKEGYLAYTTWTAFLLKDFEWDNRLVYYRLSYADVVYFSSGFSHEYDHADD
jgi:hypothetical protein